MHTIVNKAAVNTQGKGGPKPEGVFSGYLS